LHDAALSGGLDRPLPRGAEALDAIHRASATVECSRVRASIAVVPEESFGTLIGTLDRWLASGRRNVEERAGPHGP
jgi:hypothetical protein